MRPWVLLTAILLVGFGCELPEGEATGTGKDPANDVPDVPVVTNSVLTNAAPTNAVVDTDAEQWALISWQGDSAAGAKRVMDLDAKIDSNTQHVRFSFEKFPFGSEYPMGCFFVWDGSKWRGGKFDWIRPPGQGYKTLENIHSGYNGLRAPSSGTKCAFAWATSSKRSNLAITEWP